MKVLTVIGARPQFIKAATVSRELRQTMNMSEVLVHTGQHFDENMSQVFFDELDIPKPDYNLGIGGGSHGQNTGRMIESIESAIVDEKPDLVLVYGDTDSTLAGALAAAKLHIPVAHVEAGLRSYNRRMPEEINRILTDQLSTILFCPTQTAVSNLESEGFPHRLARDSKQIIANVGDVMYDAALYYASMTIGRSSILEKLTLSSKQFVLATVHRAENTDNLDKLSAIMDALSLVGKEIPVILPLHPRTKKKFEALEPHRTAHYSSHITFLPPLGYLDVVMLEKHAAVIATDSGGVQKEAFFHDVPCVTLREETEWVELVDLGWNRLVSPDSVQAMVAAIMEAMASRPAIGAKPYGSGNSAGLIVDFLQQF